MNRSTFSRPLWALSCAAAVLVAWPATGPAATTFTQINDPGDPHPSWASPRINNAGHVALVKVNTSNYSGTPWLWTGDWNTLTAYPGAYVANANRARPRIQINDADTIATTTNNESSHLFTTAGEVSLAGSPVPLNYKIDINNANQIAAYSALGATGRIYTGDAPYTTMTQLASGFDVTTHVAQISEAGHVLYKRGTTLYRYTPGSGSAALAGISSSSVDVDAAGGAIYHVGDNTVVHNGVVVRQSTGVTASNGEDGQVAVSDNGRYVVWTENHGTVWEDWDLWTLVDGVPTNLTNGAYGRVYNPDVNNDGTIVFAGAVKSQLWSSPYGSDAWMCRVTDTLPTVYNGHFNGNTLFGWTPVITGGASVGLVEHATGDYAAQLTAGSTAAIEQTIADIAAGGSGTLEFDFDFGGSTGQLQVIFDGQTLATLTEADDTEAGFTHVLLAGTVGPLPLLRFVFDSASAGDSVLIDNVVVVPEPTALAWLAVAGAALVVRRRVR